MKRIVCCSLIILLLISCGHKNKNTTHKPEYLKKTDIKFSEDLPSDTSFRIDIGAKSFQLIITHDEQPSITNNNESTTTIRIVDNSNQDTLYRKTYDFNELGELTKSGANNYYITLLNSGGGSGYSGCLFKINCNPKIALQPIFNFDELSFWEFNKTDKEIILYKGKWNMNPNSKSFEAHFSKHIQTIFLYKINESKISFKKLGTTKNKYDIENISLKYLKKKEALLLKDINVDDYY